MNLKILNRINIRTKVKAGALYYALFISFIVAVLSGMLIMYTYIHNSYIDRQIIQEQVVSNVKSGINIACKNPDILNYSSLEDVNLFGNDYDVVQLRKEHWGVYDLIYARSKRQSYKASKIAFVGDHLDKKEDVALYLTDRKKYLSISGNTLLIGSCYLPKLGIKRAYIEGQGYKNRELVFGTIQQSKNELPALNSDKIKYLESLIKNGISKEDSVIELNAKLVRNEISNSFYNKPLIIYSDIITKLQRLTVSGNVILRFDKEITIGSDCNLKDVIIIAPSVIFEEGFNGQLQVLATDKILVNNACKFKYPSFLGVLKSGTESRVSIVIGKNSIIAGGVLLYSLGSNTKAPLKLNIDESAKIYGTVYCNGFVQLKGSVFGTLYCEGFTLKTDASLYENHLLNATVDYTKLPSKLARINLVGDPINEKIIKWVE